MFEYMGSIIKFGNISNDLEAYYILVDDEKDEELLNNLAMHCVINNARAQFTHQTKRYSPKSSSSGGGGHRSGGGGHRSGGGGGHRF